jgi:hypothetical protein
MQPITIEPLSYVGIIIIVITLVYGYFKYRRVERKKDIPQPQSIQKSTDDESSAVIAVIAMLMEGKPFRIKRIILSGKQDKVSSWRHFGRQEIMRRRMNVH